MSISVAVEQHHFQNDWNNPVSHASHAKSPNQKIGFSTPKGPSPSAPENQVAFPAQHAVIAAAATIRKNSSSPVQKFDPSCLSSSSSSFSPQMATIATQLDCVSNSSDSSAASSSTMSIPPRPSLAAPFSNSSDIKDASPYLSSDPHRPLLSSSRSYSSPGSLSSFNFSSDSSSMSEQDRLRTPRVFVDASAAIKDEKVPAPEDLQQQETKPTPPSDSHPQRQPLRKLKSSLKLPQLHKSYLTPNISPKSVRFATRLEKVKTFNGKDSPLAVSAHNTPLGSPNFDFDVDMAVDDYFSNSGASLPAISLDSEEENSSDSDADDENSWFSGARHRYKMSFTNFSAPQNLYTNSCRPVYLQHIGFSNDKTLLELSVMCANLAFEKHLSLKMTFNDWQSSVIYNNATYVKSFSLVNFDQFKFVIPLTNLPSAINVQFCIKYCVAGQTHWDNNCTKNYSVGLARCEKRRSRCKTKKNKLSGAKNESNFAGAEHHACVKENVSNSRRGEDESEPASNAFAPTVQQAKSSIAYNDLVSRLMKVKMGESDAEKNSPQSPQSPQSAPRTKYSRSFLARELKTESPGSPSSLSSSTVSTSSSSPSLQNESYKNYTTTPPPTAQLVTKPALCFQNTAFNSNSYANLLRTYCFSGTPPHEAQSATPTPAAISAGVSSAVGDSFSFRM